MGDLMLTDDPGQKKIGLAAAQNFPVIITGESGTGKQLHASEARLLVAGTVPPPATTAGWTLGCRLTTPRAPTPAPM